MVAFSGKTSVKVAADDESEVSMRRPSAFSLINTSTPVACNTVSVDAVMALSPIAVKMEHMAEIYLNRIVS